MQQFRNAYTNSEDIWMAYKEEWFLQYNTIELRKTKPHTDENEDHRKYQLFLMVT